MIRDAPVDDRTFARACATVEGHGWVAAVEADMRARTGRPRVHPWAAIFVVLQITALEGFGSLLLSDAARVAQRLTTQQRARIGLSTPLEYSHIESAASDLDRALRETVDTATGEVFPPRLGLSLTSLMTGIASDFIPASIPARATQSIDSTDYETHYRRRSWRHHMKPDVPAEALPEKDFVPAKTEVNEKGWPRTGCDGRFQHTIDPDARDGYRAGKNLSRKSVFVGWDLHTATDTPDLGGVARPPLFRALSLAPAGSLKSEPGLALVDALAVQGRCPEVILADRGYSYLKPEYWARPLDQRGVRQVLDLHTSQRVQHPGPIPGTIYLDGGLFTDAVPKHLRSLPGYSLGMTGEEQAALAARYDDRAPYAFSTQGSPDHQRGTQRYRGPALAGKVRCPNTPRSMRLDPATRPTTQCTPGVPCACGVTVTLGPDDYIQTRQRDLYGTTAWKASYGRRSAVESGNAVLKVHHARLQRGSTRVMGTNKTGILLAFIVAAANVSLLITRYGYDVGAPPADDVEPVAPLPSSRTALHRKRPFARRNRSTSPPRGTPPSPPRPATAWTRVAPAATSTD